MELCFRYPVPGDIVDGIIDKFESGPDSPVHVEVRFAGGKTFSSQAPRGARWLGSINTATDIPRWEVIPLPWEETEHAIEFCNAIAGMPYDWIGAANSAAHVPLRSTNRVFCSAVCADIISRCGIFGVPVLSPADLHKFIKRLLTGEKLTAVSIAALAALPEFNYSMEEKFHETCDPEFVDPRRRAARDGVRG